jgi:cytidylate kinase
VIVAIAGPIGVGKSTVARQLAERLGVRVVSAGEVFRDLARQRGLSVLELNRAAEDDPSLDREVDRLQAALARQGPCVVESRLSGWMVDADLKVWLRAPLAVRAARVAQRDGLSLAAATTELQSREASEWGRYRSLYGIDVNDLSPYHLVVDTSVWSAETIVDALLLFIRGRQPAVRP